MIMHVMTSLCVWARLVAAAVALSVLAYMLAEVPLPMAVKHYVYGESGHRRCAADMQRTH